MPSFFILASSHKSGKYSGLSTPTLIFNSFLKKKKHNKKGNFIQEQGLQTHI